MTPEILEEKAKAAVKKALSMANYLYAEEDLNCFRSMFEAIDPDCDDAKIYDLAYRDFNRLAQLVWKEQLEEQKENNVAQ